MLVPLGIIEDLCDERKSRIPDPVGSCTRSRLKSYRRVRARENASITDGGSRRIPMWIPFEIVEDLCEMRKSSISDPVGSCTGSRLKSYWRLRFS